MCSACDPDDAGCEHASSGKVMQEGLTEHIGQGMLVSHPSILQGLLLVRLGGEETAPRGLQPLAGSHEHT